jgi:acetyl-CoA carboxylase biotin carboxyl carrier protein
MTTHDGARRNGHGPVADTAGHVADRAPDHEPDYTTDHAADHSAGTAHETADPGPDADTSTRPCRFHLRSGDTVIDIEWYVQGPAAQPAESPVRADDPRPAAAAGRARRAEPDGPAADTAPDELRYVRAPMVGTFYHAPEAGARPFVGVGDIVQPGQTVGILEVMKMMNPVTADAKGRVVDLLVADAHPVEYDQPLIALEPLGRG